MLFFSVLFISSMAWAQIVVPTFGTRGQVDELFLQNFMSAFRAEVSVTTNLNIDPGEILTAGIAGSLNADLTYLMADTMGKRFAVSGELSEDDRLLNKAPFSVRILLVDSEQKRQSDTISLPLSEDSLSETVAALARQVQEFTSPGNLPEQGSASLFVTSTPAGAEVRVNGVNVATTPLSTEIMLAPGRYEIELRKDGFKPVTRTVDLKEDSGLMQSFELIPAIGGSVQVKSYPNARVLLDGVDVGATPLTVQALPGTHTIYLQRLGFKPIGLDIRVENYRVLRVEHRLEPEAENVLFWDLPSTRLIYINNVLQTRDYVLDNAAGTYLITVRGAGESYSFEIVIDSAGVYELDIEQRIAVKFENP